MYPLKVVSPEDLERRRPLDLVQTGGRTVAQYPEGWALVDAGAAVDDNPLSIDDA